MRDNKILKLVTENKKLFNCSNYFFEMRERERERKCQTSKFVK